MISCTRQLRFEAGHRILGHENKCALLHGHSYRVEISARSSTGSGLDSLGRVIDFGVLKRLVGAWIEAHWDHRCLLDREDVGAIRAVTEAGRAVPDACPIYVLPYPPTAENIALYLLEVVCPQVLAGASNMQVEVFRVVVHETPNCSAEASLQEGR